MGVVGVNSGLAVCVYEPDATTRIELEAGNASIVLKELPTAVGNCKDEVVCFFESCRFVVQWLSPNKTTHFVWQSFFAPGLP